jgi:phosphate starvation-inducible protein PhoH and related proteins
MNELTIHFDNSSEATAVLGHGGDLPKRIQTAFGVQITTRDIWIKIVGETEEDVQRVSRFIQCLRYARSQGVDLRQHGTRYALNAFVEGREQEILDLYRQQIFVSPTKHAVTPRTFGQSRYLEQIRKHDICFGVGPAGTGKTYLAMAMAISHLLQDKVSRILLTRPAVEAGEALGFLPGDLHDKVTPYLRPLYDALHDMMDPAVIERHMATGVIEVAPLAYMRGRTLNNSFIILDEAQNTTAEQMLMFLTRTGFNSKVVITGDPSQTDLPSHKTSGLREAVSLLRGIHDIGIADLDDSDVVRHELVQKIIKAYRIGRAETKNQGAA